MPDGHPEGAPPLFESLREIHASGKFKISLRALENHSADEGWVDLRLDFQAKVAAKVATLTTRKLAIAQAATREEIHTGARLGVRKVIQALRDQSLPMSDMVGAIRGLGHALRVTAEAADPEEGKGVLVVGPVRWNLLRVGLDPVEDADILDVMPE